MPLLISCPTCSVKLNIPESFLGKKVRCASCSTVFEVTVVAPAGAAESPKQAAPKELPFFQMEEASPDLRDGSPLRDDLDESADTRRGGYIRRDLLPHRGGLILGLGIGSVVGGALELMLGLMCCSLPLVSIPLGVTSWLLGQGDMRQMDKGDMDPDGRGSTQGGYICGIVGSGLGIVGLMCVILRMILLGTLMLGTNMKR